MSKNNVRTILEGSSLLLIAVAGVFMSQKKYNFQVSNSPESRVVTFNTTGHVHNTDEISLSATSAQPFTVISRRYADRKYSSHVSSTGYEYALFTLPPDHWEIRGHSPVRSTVMTKTDAVHVAVDCPIEGVPCYSFFDNHSPYLEAVMVFVSLMIVIRMAIGILFKEV